jgi:hypothetical protein
MRFYSLLGSMLLVFAMWPWYTTKHGVTQVSGSVAQLDRARGYEPRSRGFKSLLTRFLQVCCHIDILVVFLTSVVHSIMNPCRRFFTRHFSRAHHDSKDYCYTRRFA